MNLQRYKLLRKKRVEVVSFLRKIYLFNLRFVRKCKLFYRDEK